MQKNRNLLSLCMSSALSLLCSLPSLAEEKTTLVIWTKNNTQVAYVLNEEPKISFTDTDMVVTVQNVEVSYPLSDMLRLTYADDEEMDITDLHTGDSSFLFNGDCLLFPSLKAGTTVSFYSLDGTLVFAKTVSKQGEYAFSLSDLSSGVYMVNVNGITYKIVKQ